MSILIKEISKEYGTQKALDNISLNIAKGEIVGLLGPNGAGKSTLMKIITCFIPPTEGTVEVCGFDIFDNPIEVRKAIGYLPEHNPLYLEMYVKEFLEFIAGIHKFTRKQIRQRVEEMIELTGLTKECSKKIGTLSKGYRQRVGIAQALIHDPEVLILDEPTTGLDPNQLQEIRGLISTIGQTKTVMLSTHIMQEVEAVCARTIIINEGKIVADESLENLTSQNRMKNRFMVEFQMPIDTDILLASMKNVRIHSVQQNTYVFEVDTQEDIRSEMFAIAVKQGWTILTIRKEEKTLEEIFRDVTSK